MIKSLMCVMACNKYPTSPLAGCVEDGARIIEMYREHGWEGPVRFHKDDQVTNQNLRECMKWFVDEINTGRYTNALFVVSGHGTSIPAPGRKDPTRELFCPYDIDNLWHSRELMSDEDYESMLNQINPALKGKVKADFWALCCNSGGLVTTQMDDTADVIVADPSTRVRYLRNPWEAEIAEWRRQQSAQDTAVAIKAFNHIDLNLFVDDDSVWAYRSAARSNQYSYEINSPTFGKGDTSRIAMTENVKAAANAPMRQLHTLNQKFIDVTYQFDQCPQLWAPTWRLDTDIFSAPTGVQ